jgi:DNA-binding PadR family transcriptional regulator
MPDTPRRMVRLSDEHWEALERIAERQRLIYGAFPSRAAAIAWLIEREQAKPQPRPPLSVPGS